MNMFRAMELLKQDLKELKKCDNRIYFHSEIFKTYTNYEGIPIGRMIHFYGKPDCGKTLIAKDIISKNPYNTFVYISANKDDVAKMKYPNAAILMSNIFEDTIAYLENIDKGDIDIVFIDNINNMLSREELLSAFTKQLDNRDILNKYIKKISLLAAQKDFSVIIFNGINAITNKSKYGYIIDKEAVASFEIEKVKISERYIKVKITPVRNLMAKVNDVEKFELFFSN